MMPEKKSSTDPPVKRRIVIIDDHPLMRRGLTALIGCEPDLTVCAEAAAPQAGLEAIASFHPDLVIVDLSLGDGDGFALVEEIRSAHADLPVLVLTLYDTPACADRAFQAGANGFVSKQEMDGTLANAIRTVLSGGKFVSAKVMGERSGPDTK